jgi:5-(carboxyamino)imidazole ribonucleotide synthase
MMETSKKTFPVIGIIGGGQLGKMFIQKSSQWSVPVNILDRDTTCPASLLANHHIVGSITDSDEIQKLSDISDVLTWEIEHIDVNKLIELQQQGKTIIPNPEILKIIQDKGKQKLFYQDNNIPTAPFFTALNKTEAKAKLAQTNFKKVAVKACTGGYDGKGVFISDTAAILENPSIIPFDSELMIEEFVPCKTEIAVLVARNRKGELAVYPAIEMEFDPQSNLVSFLISPANIPLHLEQRAEQIALQCAEAFGSAGLFAVELFLSEDDALLVNEIAPRPHNSAHHTIEGFYTSQYEQLLRVLLDLQLGSTHIKMPCAMINIVGPETGSGKYRLKYFNELNTLSGVYIHLYGKEESKPNRKLGHITIVQPSLEKVLEITQKVRTLTEIEIIAYSKKIEMK